MKKRWVVLGLAVLVGVGIYLNSRHITESFIRTDSALQQKMRGQQPGLANVMHDLYKLLARMKPYMMKKEEFSKKTNEKSILHLLSEFRMKTASTTPASLTDRPGFAVTFKHLRDHVRKTEDAFVSGEKEIARLMLNASANLCSSCHTQLPTSFVPKLEWVRDYFALRSADAFESAEFLYMTRRYGRAMYLYDTLIREYGDNAMTEETLKTALNRKIAMFARVYRKPLEAQVSLETDYKNEKLPFYFRENLKTWIGYFQKWSDENITIDPDEMSSEELIAFAESKLDPSINDRSITVSDSHRVNYLRVSGLLYEHLFRQPQSPFTPKILLLLAKCERQLRDEFFLSLADMYLEECVTGYSGTQEAMDCQEEIDKYSDFEPKDSGTE